MPEVAIRICEFDRELAPAALSRIDIRYAAFAFFLCEAVDDEDLLAEFDARNQGFVCCSLSASDSSIGRFQSNLKVEKDTQVVIIR
jgi:hypothetical protein